MGECMNIRVLSVILFFLFFAARVYAAGDRNLIIQKELDCVSQQKNLGLTWTDVCSMPDPAPTGNIGTDGPPSNGFPAGRVHTFSLAGLVNYYHYAEPEKVKKYTGVWLGEEGKYIFRPPQGNILNNPLVNFYSLEGTYASGRSDKEGNVVRTFSDNSISKVIQKDIPSYMFELRALLGKDFTPWSFLRITPYLGGGVRYKADESAGHYNQLADGTPIVGYDRSELSYYILTGLTFDVMANNDYEISLNAEYDFLIKGYQRDRFSDADQFTVPLFSVNSNKALFAQDHGFGAKFSLKFLRHFSMVDVFIEPFVDYWHINASKGTLIYETGNFSTSTSNKNSTVEIGTKFGIEF